MPTYIINHFRTRWWFQIFFIFHPYLGKMNPFWRAYVSNGLVQPPTREPFYDMMFFLIFLINLSNYSRFVLKPYIPSIQPLKPKHREPPSDHSGSGGLSPRLTGLRRSERKFRKVSKRQGRCTWVFPKIVGFPKWMVYNGIPEYPIF